MAKPVIVVDGDDTLWFVESLYDDARRVIADAVGALGLDSTRWEERQRAIDVKNVAMMGLSPARFPTSCVEAYRVLAAEGDMPTDPLAESLIRGLAEQVFEREAPLAERAAESLAVLCRVGRLHLLTKGDHTVQQRRIATSGLKRFFEGVHIVAEKEPASFLGILSEAAANPESSWSIGNSLPSDIFPALRCGMSAVWVDAHVWEHERREVTTPEARLFQASSLSEAVDLVQAEILGVTTSA
jgi:putative hydrolase of the HAD superfamily